MQARPNDTASVRLAVVFDGVTVAVPEDPAEVFTTLEVSVPWPVPVVVWSSDRSVNVATVNVCAVSFIRIATPTTSEFGNAVVCAGIVIEVVLDASFAAGGVPSAVVVVFWNDRMRAPAESPVVPVVRPVHVTVGASLAVPSAIRTKMYIRPPLAVADVLGKPDTSVHPEGVDTVAVMLRDSVTSTMQSPLTVAAFFTGLRFVGLATLLAVNTAVPAARKVGVATAGYDAR